MKVGTRLQYTPSVVIEACRRVLSAYAPPAGHTSEQSIWWHQVSHALMSESEPQMYCRGEVNVHFKWRAVGALFRDMPIACDSMDFFYGEKGPLECLLLTMLAYSGRLIGLQCDCFPGQYNYNCFHPCGCI